MFLKCSGVRLNIVTSLEPDRVVDCGVISDRRLNSGD